MSVGKLFQNHSSNCYQDQHMEHCPVIFSIITDLKENHYLIIPTIKLSYF